MTRIDYELLAEALRRAVEQCKGNQAYLIGAELCVHAIADELARRTARFERARFLHNAGIKS